MTEARPPQVADLAELNRLFTAWVRDGLPPRRSTPRPAQAPLARLVRRPARCPCPTPAAAARRRSCGPSRRTVTKTATVSLHGNLYQVDPALVRRTVELVFDPFDLTVLSTVRRKGRRDGDPAPHRPAPGTPRPAPDDGRPATAARAPPASTT